MVNKVLCANLLGEFFGPASDGVPVARVIEPGSYFFKASRLYFLPKWTHRLPRKEAHFVIVPNAAEQA